MILRASCARSSIITRARSSALILCTAIIYTTLLLLALWGFAQLLQGHVRFLTQHGLQLAMMGRNDHRLASRTIMTRTDLSGPFALLQKLLDHAQRNPVAIRDFLPTALLIVVGSQDPFPQVQR